MCQVKNDVNSHLSDRSQDGYIAYYSKDKLINPTRIESEKLIRGNLSNLNGVVLDANQQKIFCRQLAFYQLMHEATYQEELSSPNTMSNVAFLANNEYDKQNIKLRADQYYICGLSNLGRQLHEIVTNTITTKNTIFIMFYSKTHAMAITIQRKPQGMLALKFYDPNLTQTHKRLLFENSDNLIKLQIEDLFYEPSLLKTYFHNTQNATLAVYNDPLHLEPEATTQGLSFCDKYKTN